MFTLKVAAIPGSIDSHIHVDQFGYLPASEKIAVISNPITGYNNTSAYSPGTIYQLRRWSDDSVFFTAAITSWNGGATHAQSGDKVWWFNFSTITTPGSYYVYDTLRGKASYRFEISDSVYNNVLKTAMRTYYYQRCGTPKDSTFARAAWSDIACHSSTQQDFDCRLYNNNSISTSKDLHGGWHDAGDYNKYVNFSFEAVVDLLLAYQENPSVWRDNYGIPESGNGIPDILDEIKWELDWLLRMQQSNGSVLSVVGVIGSNSASPPSADATYRKYGPVSSSATMSAAAMFALASIQYNSLGTPASTTYASTLKTAAINAWNWATTNTYTSFYNASVSLAAGEQEISSSDYAFRQLCAASFLYVATGTTNYKTFFENNYTNAHLMQWSYAYPFEHSTQDAMLYYSRAAGASSSVSNAIKNTFAGSVNSGNTDMLAAYNSNTDAYRAYLSDNNYTWGSNSTKSSTANMFLDMNVYGLSPASSLTFRKAAEGYIHYLHGVNPTGFCFLSNTASIGAENSINEFYHSWFTDGSSLWDRVGTSTYGPAPGFVSGGPNPSYGLDACCSSSCSTNSLCASASLNPPLNQPIQKSYRDWNTSWPQDSWEVTENGIYYEASYVHLLSKYISAIPSIPLPLNKLDFRATLLSNSEVSLKWSARGYPSCSQFTVQRSSDGVNWTSLESIDTVTPGTPSESGIDPKPLEGVSYYRLMVHACSTSNSFSAIQRIDNSAAAIWQLYPNPVKSQIFLSSVGSGQTAGSMRVQVFNTLGIRCLDGWYTTSSGAIAIEVGQLPTGLYYLEIENPGMKIYRLSFLKDQE